MDTSEIASGKRERAPVEGMMGSDVPTQVADKKCRAGDLHLASVAGKEVVEENGQWWQSDTKGKIDAQDREDLGASLIMDGGLLAFSARVAEECGRVSGQELTEGGGRSHVDRAYGRRNGN